MSELNITLIQSDLSWEDKQANLSKLSSLIAKINRASHIIVLPEMFSTGFTMNAGSLAEDMEGDTVNWMRKISLQKRCILTGSFIATENGQYFNRLIWMQPDGKFACYDKRHLFGFAGEDKYYTRGEKRLIVSVNGWKLQLLICYDLRFPVWSRQQPVSETSEYDAIIYVANWPAARNHAWKSLLVARAIENQAYVIGVNRVGADGKGHSYDGDSMLVNPLGISEYHAPAGESVHTVNLSKEKLEDIRKQFPFRQDADIFYLAE
jgi:predicted amidohydrolase